MKLATIFRVCLFNSKCFKPQTAVMSPWFVEHLATRQMSLHNKFPTSLLFLSRFSVGINSIDWSNQWSFCSWRTSTCCQGGSTTVKNRKIRQLNLQPVQVLLLFSFTLCWSESKARELKTTRLTSECNSSCLCLLHFSELTYGQADAAENCAAVFSEHAGCFDSGLTAT